MGQNGLNGLDRNTRMRASASPRERRAVSFSSASGFQARRTKMTADSSSFYDLNAATLTGKPYPFDQLKGKTVLIVNTASACGFTPQYAGLQTLYERLHDKGFVILGFPCNQFGSQESASEQDIGVFCQRNYGVTFPMMSKVDVNGPNTHEVYQWLKARKSQLGLQAVKWNFEKFLVNKDGQVVQRFSSLATPEEIAKHVEQIL
ncbi:hypothetical protein SeMB42_g03982 [Synchytrium endobioticum]|uniref:Glutathione peroxidase n=1 Tax=Synchytrium endobioticum TaxID=286115 RepID=A0A507D2A8_9FUNG|nr:hypothetical protein SeMB42_g03982 [Synchytrium endobioticum]